jgi:hypothetical protein
VGGKARQDKGTSAVHKIVKHGAYKTWDFLAGHLIACSILIFLFSLGIDYAQDEERIVHATVTAAEHAGSTELADGSKALAARLPETWQQPLQRWSLPAAAAIFGAACLVLLLRAPSRAHALKELGWGIAFPGFLGALATLILEWRAMKWIKATLSGERSASTLWSEGTDAAIACSMVLWPALVGGFFLLLVGVLCERRWRHGHGVRKDGSRLSTLHVISHFLIVVGLVPWIHFLTAIVLDAFTKGASTGASMAPFTANPLVYVSGAALFAFGASLYWLARGEVKRLEAAERD